MGDGTPKIEQRPHGAKQKDSCVILFGTLPICTTNVINLWPVICAKQRICLITGKKIDTEELFVYHSIRECVVKSVCNPAFEVLVFTFEAHVGILK